MGEHIAQQNVQPGRAGGDRPNGTPEAAGRKLLRVVVYDRDCRIGDRVELATLAETSEVGDWNMSEYRAACGYAASQGWLTVEGDTLTLTTAGLAAA